MCQAGTHSRWMMDPGVHLENLTFKRWIVQ